MPIIRDYCAGMDVAMGYNPLTGEIYDTYVDYGDLVPAGGQTGQTADLPYFLTLTAPHHDYRNKNYEHFLYL
jgi:hypothetical protein